jgi:23S rRNA-/tRNA-specific pseudouridylate synthase
VGDGGGDRGGRGEEDAEGLSASARALWDRRGELSGRERRGLELKVRKERLASAPLPLIPWGGAAGASGASALQILYADADLCVCLKPSGVLSVPGPRRNPSLAQLVREALLPGEEDGDGGGSSPASRSSSLAVDSMVVHRLDMDTSGVIAYALNPRALAALHRDFRSDSDSSPTASDLGSAVHRRGRRGVHKTYEALVHGHLACPEMEIDLPLERDPDNLPFMRVARPRRRVEEEKEPPAETSGGAGRNSTRSFASAAAARTRRLLMRDPKPSLTEVRVAGYEWLEVPRRSPAPPPPAGGPGGAATNRLAVTRVRLSPRTGRTHQLRVHLSAVGHPIVGDDVYGTGEDLGDPAGAPSALAAVDGASDLCLCAAELCLRHPSTGAPLRFACLPPF